MEIRNKTLYDKDLILKYNQFYLNSYIKKNFIVISAISLVFIVYMMINLEWMYALILFGILAFYLVVTYLMQKLSTKRILKRSPLVEQPVMQSYMFRDENFDVINIKTYTVSYEDIVRYKRANTFYMLQSRDKKSFLVKYDGFDTKMECERLGRFLDEKYGKKKR